MSITDARLREMMNASVPASTVWELARALLASREDKDYADHEACASIEALNDRLEEMASLRKELDAAQETIRGSVQLGEAAILSAQKRAEHWRSSVAALYDMIGVDAYVKTNHERLGGKSSQEWCRHILDERKAALDAAEARLTEIGAIAIEYADGTNDAPVEATDWNRVSALADGRAS